MYKNTESSEIQSPSTNKCKLIDWASEKSCPLSPIRHHHRYRWRDTRISIICSYIIAISDALPSPTSLFDKFPFLHVQGIQALPTNNFFFWTIWSDMVYCSLLVKSPSVNQRICYSSVAHIVTLIFLGKFVELSFIKVSYDFTVHLII